TSSFQPTIIHSRSLALHLYYYIVHIPLPHPSFFFFFHDTAPTETYTLSLHDALPIFTTSPAITRWWNPASSDSITTTAVSAPAKIGRHTSELQSRGHLVCRLLLEKKKNKKTRKTQQQQQNKRKSATPLY